MSEKDKTRIVFFYFVTAIFSVSLIGLSFHFWLKYLNIKNEGIVTKAFITDVNKDPLTHDLYEYGIIYIIDNDTIQNNFNGEGFDKNDTIEIVVYRENTKIFELSIIGLLNKMFFCAGFGTIFITILIIGIVKPKYILKYSKDDIYYGD